MAYEVPASPFRLDETGLSRKTLRGLIQRGEVRRLAFGAYVSTATQDSLAVRAQALQLVVPPRAVVCRTTAAWLYGLDVLPRDRNHLNPRPELAVTEGTAPTRRSQVAGYVQILHERDVRLVEGVRATSPVRTAADLGRWLPRYAAIGALDAFLRSGLVARGQLTAEAERWFGFKGVRQLRELTGFADSRAESARESWLRLLVHDAGFPDATPQVPIVRGQGLEPYRLDLGIEEVRVGLDYDGREFHPDDDPHDAERRAYIRGQGWTLLVARRGDLERPQRLVDGLGEFVAPVRAPRRGLEVITGFAPRCAPGPGAISA